MALPSPAPRQGYGFRSFADVGQGWGLSWRLNTLEITKKNVSRRGKETTQIGFCCIYKVMFLFLWCFFFWINSKVNSFKAFFRGSESANRDVFAELLRWQFSIRKFKQMKNWLGVDHSPSSQVSHHKYRKLPQKFIPVGELQSESFCPTTNPTQKLISWIGVIFQNASNIKNFSLVEKKKDLQNLPGILGRDVAPSFRRCRCFILGNEFQPPHQFYLCTC